MSKNKQKSRIATALMITGLLLILSAVCLLCYNLWEEHRADEISQNVLIKLNQSVYNAPPLPDGYISPDMEMPTKTVDGREYIGKIDISSLGVSLPILSRWSDYQLKIAPCRYKGSAYQDNLIIAAHNYRNHFGRLRSLQSGDEVIFTDIYNNQFKYQVLSIETLDSTDTEKMEAGDWDLTLFTCTYGGRHRITVRCKKSVEP